MQIEQTGFGRARQRYEVIGPIDCSMQELADRCFAQCRSVKNRVDRYHGFQIQNYSVDWDGHRRTINQEITIVVLMISPESAANYSI